MEVVFVTPQAATLEDIKRTIGEETQPTVAPETTSPRPTVMDVVKCITSAQPQFNEVDVLNMLGWLKQRLEQTRAQGGDTFHPNDAEMRTKSYDVFDMVIPHGQLPRPGTPHDILSRHVIDPSLGETALLHNQTVVGRRTDCNVSVSTSSIG
jgi:hypothetical protein